MGKWQLTYGTVWLWWYSIADSLRLTYMVKDHNANTFYDSQLYYLPTLGLDGVEE